MKHANRAHRRSPARYVIGAGLFCVLTWFAVHVAVWLWTSPNAPLVWGAVLLPLTWVGNRWSKRKELDEQRRRTPTPRR